jgi:hypothetical protein
MNKVLIVKLKAILGVALCCCGILWGTAAAQRQQEETEPARNSSLIGTSLPAGAQRVLPDSVPAEVDQTLDKIVAGGGGKIARGGTEVIVWTAGGGAKRVNSAQIASQMQNAWKSAGWMFEVGGEQDGATLFTLLKDGAERRAVIGFYGADNGVFVLALTELLKNDGGESNFNSGRSRNRDEEPINNSVEEPEAPLPQSSVQSENRGGSLRSLVGKWEKKSTMGGRVDANSGRYLGSSGNYESYEIFPDGRVAYSTLISVQQGGCNLSAFGQNQGRAVVSGSQVTFNLSGGTIDRKDTCNSSGDYKRPTKATNYTYSWTIGDDGYGNTQLCLTESDGKQYCYRKVK